MLLSIVIPTYNRCQFLKENLQTLLPQVKKYKDLVDITIFDNDSNDYTKDIVESTCKRNNTLVRYVKHDKNIGATANIDAAAFSSKSKYTFIMGDDDVIAPHFMDVIIPLLQSPTEYGIIFWNRLSGNTELKNNKLFDSSYHSSIEEYSTPDFIKTHLDEPNFLSSLLFYTECWQIGASLVDKNLDGYRWYGQILLGALQLVRKCLYYYFPLVIQRNPSKPWARLWPHYGIVEMNRLFHIFDTYIPGIETIWLKKNSSLVDVALKSIVLDQKYYRQEKKELMAHFSRLQKIKGIIFLYTPMPRITIKIVDKLETILRFIF